MIVDLKWLQVCFIVLFQSVISAYPITSTTEAGPLVYSTTDLELLTSKQILCGDDVPRILENICFLHNSPERRKRYVARDCCPGEDRTQRGCSLDYLGTFYCKIINRAGLKRIIDQMKKKRQSRNNHIMPEEQRENNVISNESSSPDYVQVRNATLSRRYRQRAYLNHNSSSGKHTPHSQHENQKARGKRNCTCRKRREKKIRRSFKNSSGGQVGMIIDTGEPFYVSMGN